MEPDGRRSDEVVEYAEAARHRDAPGQDVLPADAILEFHLALDHQYLATLSSKTRGQRGAREAAAHNDDVDVHGPSDDRDDSSSLRAISSSET